MSQALALTALLLTYGYGTVPDGASSYTNPHIFAPALPTNAGYEIMEVVPVGTVSVRGNVVRPGEYDYYPGMTIESAIGNAGSFLDGADYDGIQIVRLTPDGEKTYVATWWVHWQRLVLLKPGDALVVPNRNLASY